MNQAIIIHGLLEKLGSPDTCDDAASALYDCGEAIVDHLLVAITDHSLSNKVREICAEVLGAAVPRGPKELLDILRTSSGEIADLAAWGLRWNHASDEIEPKLCAMLRAQSPSVRMNASRALRYIHVGLQHLDSRIFEAGQDPELGVRLNIMKLLCELAGCHENFTSEYRELGKKIAIRSSRSDSPKERKLSEKLLNLMKECSA